MAQFDRFKCYGKDALLLSLLAYNVGAGRILGTKMQRKSQLLRKIEAGIGTIFRNIYLFVTTMAKF